VTGADRYEKDASNPTQNIEKTGVYLSTQNESSVQQRPLKFFGDRSVYLLDKIVLMGDPFDFRIE